MPTSPEARSNAMQWAGGMLERYSSGAIAVGAGAVAGALHVVTCPMEIVAAYIYVTTATSATNLAFSFGTVADDDALLDSFPVAATATGLIEVPLESFVSTKLSPGDVLRTQSDAANSATGSYTVILFLNPRTE